MTNNNMENLKIENMQFTILNTLQHVNSKILKISSSKPNPNQIPLYKIILKI